MSIKMMIAFACIFMMYFSSDSDTDQNLRVFIYKDSDGVNRIVSAKRGGLLPAAKVKKFAQKYGQEAFDLNREYTERTYRYMENASSLPESFSDYLDSYNAREVVLLNALLNEVYMIRKDLPKVFIGKELDEIAYSNLQEKYVCAVLQSILDPKKYYVRISTEQHRVEKEMKTVVTLELYKISLFQKMSVPKELQSFERKYHDFVDSFLTIPRSADILFLSQPEGIKQQIVTGASTIGSIDTVRNHTILIFEDALRQQGRPSDLSDVELRMNIIHEWYHMSSKRFWNNYGSISAPYEGRNIDIYSLDELAAHIAEIYSAPLKVKGIILNRLQRVYPSTTSYLLAGEMLIKPLEHICKRRYAYNPRYEKERKEGYFQEDSQFFFHENIFSEKILRPTELQIALDKGLAYISRIYRDRYHVPYKQKYVL